MAPKILYIIALGVLIYSGWPRTIFQFLKSSAPASLELETVPETFVEPVVDPPPDDPPPDGFFSLLQDSLKFATRLYENATRPIFNHVPMGRYLMQAVVYLSMTYSIIKNVRFFYENKFRYLVFRDDTTVSRLHGAHKKAARDYGSELRAVKMNLNAYRNWYAFHMKECQCKDFCPNFFRQVSAENDGHQQQQGLASDSDGAAVGKSQYTRMLKELKNLDREMKAATLKIDYFQGSNETLLEELNYQIHRFWPNMYEDEYFTTGASKPLPEAAIEVLKMMQVLTLNLKEYVFEDIEAYDGASLDCPESE